MEVITSQIPRKQIQDYSKVREQVLSGLEERGYTETSPACQFKVISQSESEFVYGIFLSAGSQNTLLSQHSVEVDEPITAEGIIDGLSQSLTDGAWSSYNIIGEKHFLAELEAWLQKYAIAPDGGDESPEAWTVTLSGKQEVEGIEWTAQQGKIGLRKNGTLFLVHEELYQLGQEAACEEVRSLFEIEVVPHLEGIDDLDAVFDEQIPMVIAEIFQRTRKPTKSEGQQL